MADQPKPEWDISTHGVPHPDIAPAYQVVDSRENGQPLKAKALADATPDSPQPGATGQATPAGA